MLEWKNIYFEIIKENLRILPRQSVDCQLICSQSNRRAFKMSINYALIKSNKQL